jgi:hypothetical protein
MTTLDSSFFSNFFTEGLNLVTEDNFETAAYQGFDPSVIRKQLIINKWQKTELIQILTFFVVRGTSLSDKSMGRSTKTLSQLITHLKNKGLVDTPVNRTDITIGRIVASMPEIVASVIAKFPDDCRIICNDLDVSIPVYLKFSSGAALCVSEDELKEWLTWAIEQDKVINPKKPDAVRVENFANIQYQSTFLSVSKRVSIRSSLDSITNSTL